ncbi:hypothetical protein DUNSADRAFT_6624 [Dunaliella salina]|uniref:Polymerase nucleotidyl transferase domain-containing protein n=1 Tax=Dunaliella salina TaxID=3046 RepID=A0ABQ7GMX7_DUNSA|nr:hypothetical protein DUNSADRAFT_6624 [Dunaliella salina]|eukprot:KAF5835959.1 hypothetical protein DUNSADRAFT_6624 [Dunaliella salina]
MAPGQQLPQRGPMQGAGPPMQFTNSMYPMFPTFVPGTPLFQGPMPIPPPLMRPPPVFNPAFLHQQQRQPPSPAFADNDFPMDPDAAERAGQSPYLTALTRNIVNTVHALQPEPGDVAARAAMMRVVQGAAVSALPEWRGRLQVLPFGSFVSGLGTKASDIDIVITGVREPQDPSKGFYERHERPDVARILDRGSESPKITQFGAAADYRYRPISVDISATTAAGPQAARYLAQQTQAFRALRPLVLIVKAYLKVSNLNDVASGGLSSFGLTLMVLAHLIEEQRAGNDVEDLGHMLVWFFKRYGSSYNPAQMAVSVRDGGTIPRARIDAVMGKKLDRICCIDPLTGLDCTSCPPDLDILAALASGQLDEEEEEEEEEAQVKEGLRGGTQDAHSSGGGLVLGNAAFHGTGTAKLPSPGQLGLSGQGKGDGIQGSQEHPGHTSSTAQHRSAAAGASQPVWPGEAKGSQAEYANPAGAQSGGGGAARPASLDNDSSTSSTSNQGQGEPAVAQQLSETRASQAAGALGRTATVEAGALSDVKVDEGKGGIGGGGVNDNIVRYHSAPTSAEGGPSGVSLAAAGTDGRLKLGRSGRGGGVEGYQAGSRKHSQTRQVSMPVP